ncbi:MAG: HAD-IIA family hydrolase [Magnetococcales bacterium]|nr:HAD-IIA family hydrolase [Magnetococcales bacterium]
MKAIILAAGVGSRLRPITSDKPKCLVKVAGRPILDYQIEAYRSAGITDIIIIVGYEAEKIRQYCKHIKDLRITIIENSVFSSTNNMYSLYLARTALKGEGFLLSNADVAFGPEIMARLIAGPPSAIASQRDHYSEESMKITVDSENQITGISKTIDPQMAYGVSIDIYKFSQEAAATMLDHVVKTIEVRKNLNDWTEVAIHNMLQSGQMVMEPVDIGNHPWYEIDNHEDLTTAEKIFSGYVSGREKLVFFDLDGTIYLGKDLITGAREMLQRLEEKGVKYYFLTNNSSKSKKDYAKRLDNLGIGVEEERIILSTDGCLDFLVKSQVKEIFMVGTRSMAEMFEAAGINTRSEKPEYVVIGFDTELTYEKARLATLHASKGVDLIATHCDLVCPTPEGIIPDAGAILKFIETAAGVKATRIFGKPNVEMIAHILEREGVSLDEAVIVGDRIYTDMEMARRVGCKGIMVLSGDTGLEALQVCASCPDLVVKSVAELFH